MGIPEEHLEVCKSMKNCWGRCCQQVPEVRCEGRRHVPEGRLGKGERENGRAPEGRLGLWEGIAGRSRRSGLGRRNGRQVPKKRFGEGVSPAGPGEAGCV